MNVVKKQETQAFNNPLTQKLIGGWFVPIVARFFTFKGGMSMDEWSWWHENQKCWGDNDYTYYNFWTHEPEVQGQHGFRTYIDTLIHNGEVYVRLWVDFIATGIYTHQEWV